MKKHGEIFARVICLEIMQAVFGEPGLFTKQNLSKFSSFVRKTLLLLAFHRGFFRLRSPDDKRMNAVRAVQDYSHGLIEQENVLWTSCPSVGVDNCRV